MKRDRTEYRKKYYETHKEKLREYNRKYKKMKAEEVKQLLSKAQEQKEDGYGQKKHGYRQIKYCANYNSTNYICINCFENRTAEYRGCWKKTEVKEYDSKDRNENAEKL